MSTLDLPLEALASGPEPSIDNLDADAANRIAELARLLAQKSARANGDLAADFRPYLELDEKTRSRMRNGVIRVVQALVLLEYIDPPG
jgi:hypothetical protein